LNEFQVLEKLAINNQDVRTKIGVIYFEEGRLDGAIAQFALVLSFRPNDHRARYYLATVRAEREEFERAAEEFKRIPLSSRFYVDSQIQLAFIFEKQNKIDEAIKALKAAIKAKPQNADLYLFLSGLYEKNTQFDKGIRLLKEALTFAPQDEKIYFSLGVLYDKAGNWQECIVQMRKVLKIKPDNARALNYIGYTYADRGINLDEAEALVKKALELKADDGDDSSIADSLGWVYFKKGEFEKAVTELEKAQQLAPDDPVITEHLGDAYARRNASEKAIQMYERALKLDPKKTELQDKIKKLRQEKKRP
jgi:tetratricopeptide (TPR) repeat protein